MSYPPSYDLCLSYCVCPSVRLSVCLLCVCLSFFLQFILPTSSFFPLLLSLIPFLLTSLIPPLSLLFALLSSTFPVSLFQLFSSRFIFQPSFPSCPSNRMSLPSLTYFSCLLHSKSLSSLSFLFLSPEVSISLSFLFFRSVSLPSHSSLVPYKSLPSHLSLFPSPQGSLASLPSSPLQGTSVSLPFHSCLIYYESLPSLHCPFVHYFPSHSYLFPTP